MENTNLFREMNSIPLADDDPQGTQKCLILCYQEIEFIRWLAVIADDSDNTGVERDPSLDSMSSRFTNDSLEQQNSGKIINVLSWNQPHPV